MTFMLVLIEALFHALFKSYWQQKGRMSSFGVKEQNTTLIEHTEQVFIIIIISSIKLIKNIKHKAQHSISNYWMVMIYIRRLK